MMLIGGVVRMVPPLDVIVSVLPNPVPRLIVPVKLMGPGLPGIAGWSSVAGIYAMPATRVSVAGRQFGEGVNGGCSSGLIKVKPAPLTNKSPPEVMLAVPPSVAMILILPGALSMLTEPL